MSHALIVVGNSSSHCSVCGRNALAERRHTEDSGCGVEFYGVTSLYAGREPREAAERMASLAALPYVHTVPEAGGSIVIVRNYDDAIRFYTDVFGLCVEEDFTIEPGRKRWVLLDQSRPYNRLLLLEASVAPRHYADTHSTFSLFTYEIGPVVTELKRRGIVFRRELEAAGKRMSAEFEDPDGNLVTLLG